jgi:hypothetical protein
LVPLAGHYDGNPLREGAMSFRNSAPRRHNPKTEAGAFAMKLRIENAGLASPRFVVCPVQKPT